MIEGDTVLVVHAPVEVARGTGVLGSLLVWMWFLLGVGMLVFIGFVSSSVQQFFSLATLPLCTVGVVAAILVVKARSVRGAAGERAAIVANVKGDVVTLRQPFQIVLPVKVPRGTVVEFRTLQRTGPVGDDVRDYVEVTVSVEGVLGSFAVYSNSAADVSRQLSAGLASLGVPWRELGDPTDRETRRALA